MTNREWLKTLNNEELSKWLVLDDYYLGTIEVEGAYYVVNAHPSPRLNTIKLNYTDSREGVEKWLDEERTERKYDK